MISLAMLTGQFDGHLDNFGKHRLQTAAKSAFLAMQHQAAQAGFNLQPASTFRDFTRQQTIWNEKFYGQRPVLDHDSQPINMTVFPAEQRCRTILYWSALPGASRHHWGTDLDIYDPALLPHGSKLLLEPWEYENSGYFYPLTEWLTSNMAQYGFYRPFQQANAAIAVEPWHLSYRPLAQQLESQLTPAALIEAWQGKDIAGAHWLIEHLDEVFAEYIFR